MFFQEDFRQEETEGEREVSGLTFSSAPTSCTSPSSCSLSLWIQGRGGSRGHREGGRPGSWVDGRRALDGGGGQWTGGGMLLGGQALEISVVCFSSFQDGRGLELEFGFELGGSGWVGVWGLGSKPATAGSLLVSHGQKKQPWTVPGYLSTALQSSPKKTGTQK